jgi:pimeloyl-ACP methyl ester carboxylesterase
MHTIIFKKKKIRFTDKGKGKCLVLLHGYTESRKIWETFSEKLSKKFRVVTIDLPGFGDSGIVSEVHTMELMADCVHKVLKQLKIKRCVLTGHSMGGFVTLAFAARYPEMLKGLCLFHSHPFADTPEGKVNRGRTIEMIRLERADYLMQFIPSLFAERSQEKFRKEIARLIKKAGEISPEALIAAMEGMKQRPDTSVILQTLNIPVLFIIGMKDPRIPQDRLWEMISLPTHSEALILKDIGHMGYIEAENVTLTALRDFAERCYR